MGGPPRGGPPFMGGRPLELIPIKLPALIFRPPIITDPLLGPPLRLVTLPFRSGGIMSPSTTSRDFDFFFFFRSSLPSLRTISSGMGGGGGDCIIIWRGRCLVDRPLAEERKLRMVLP